MVAVDENGSPAAVPGLLLESEAEREEWAGGQKRNQLRRQRRKEGY